MARSIGDIIKDSARGGQKRTSKSPARAVKTAAPSYTKKAEPKGRRSSGMEVNPSTGSTSTRGKVDSAGRRRGGTSKSQEVKTTHGPRKASPPPLQVNPSTGSPLPAPGSVTSAGRKRGTTAPVSKAGPRLSQAQKNKLRVDVRNKGAQVRGEHQTAAQKAADPADWGNIAANLGAGGDKRFTKYADNRKVSPTTRRYLQATGRGRGSKPQKAK